MANYDQGPIAIRYPRGNGPGVTPKANPRILEIGKAELVADGSDVALIALGEMFPIAEKAKVEFEAKGLSVALINPRWIKPLDGELISRVASKVKVVCTLEDHVLMNGFGCGVIELLNDAAIKTPVVRIGWPDEFIEHGSVPVLRKKHGLTVENCVAKVMAKLA
jgi:1-deoxy-D-xylulose-5-phosphate synthase